MSGRSKSRNWAKYYDQTSQRPTRQALLRALDSFDGETGYEAFAIDLGCGGGRDTIEILRRGWRVLAIDAERAAIEALRGRPDIPDPARLETRVARFEATDLSPASLINAGFSLPLCPPEEFPALWRRILAALPPGGRFSGQLFGERDSWAAPDSGQSGMTFLSRSEVDAMLAPLDREMLVEEEDESATPRGTPKHWHLFHVVARKP